MERNNKTSRICRKQNNYFRIQHKKFTLIRVQFTRNLFTLASSWREVCLSGPENGHLEGTQNRRRGARKNKSVLPATGNSLIHLNTVIGFFRAPLEPFSREEIEKVWVRMRDDTEEYCVINDASVE